MTTTTTERMRQMAKNCGEENSMHDKSAPPSETPERVPVCGTSGLTISRAIWDEAWIVYAKIYGGPPSQHTRLLKEGFYAGELDTFRPGWRPVDQRITDLERRLLETEAERDLAITHDRQPYPTAWAYEQVCKARDQWQQRAEELQRKLSAARKESDDKG